MECDKSDHCIAKIEPQKMCWEHSRDIGAVQYSFSICPDCLVYLVHRPSSPYPIEEIARMRRMQAFSRKKYQGCPLSSFVDYKNAKNERRENNRYSCTGHLHASFSSSDIPDHSCRVIDLSHAGISFSCNNGDVILERNIKLNLCLTDYAVTNLPVKIVSDFPSPASHEQRRYGGIFNNLSYAQESNLINLLHTCIAV
jgi:hypothetical protein